MKNAFRYFFAFLTNIACQRTHRSDAVCEQSTCSTKYVRLSCSLRKFRHEFATVFTFECVVSTMTFSEDF